jgi:Flp pilus assembly protein TadG
MYNRRPRGRRGVTLVETGIVIGVCLIFMLAIFEYGRFVMVKQLVENAAREGTRQAIVNPGSGTTAAIQATVTNYLAGQPLQGLSIQVYKADPATGANLGDWRTAKFGEGIAVQVSGGYTPMLPTFGFLPATVNLRATSLMRSEAN